MPLPFGITALEGLSGIGSIAKGIGGALGANGQQKLQKQQVRDDNVVTAEGMMRKQAMSPLRDRAMGLMLQRMGYAPQQYRSRSFLDGSRGPGPVPLGGYGHNSQPGMEDMWNMDTALIPNSSKNYDQLLNRLGWGIRD
jgi:hypothetical protein